MYLDYADLEARKERRMTMAEWAGKIDAFLRFNEYDVLDNPGRPGGSRAGPRLPRIDQCYRCGLMIPSALSTLLERGLADFLRVSFQSTTPGMKRVVADFPDDRSEYLKGPYVSAKLPFVAGTRPHPFKQVPLGFPAHAHQPLRPPLRRAGHPPSQARLAAVHSNEPGTT